MTIYCPICNRSSDEFNFVGEFCEVCVTDKLKEKIPSSVTIERCKSCERVHTANGYQEPDKEVIKEVLHRALKTKCNIRVRSFDWKKAVVRFDCDVDGNDAVFDRDVSIVVKRTMCIDCYRKTSGYYEAIFQIRGPRDDADKMLKKFMNFMEKRGAFASRVDELNNGYDIYSSSKTLASSFFQYYDLKPKRSYTLYGLKHGKEVYRNIYLLRL
ncbi:MAG TPA: NMD3-related protein [Candidatus Acidoferrum sp.]|nr:NMD3-related protein [Candidatus Acidoferrum sp.]